MLGCNLTFSELFSSLHDFREEPLRTIYTGCFLQKMKCCEVGISKLRDNVSKSGMSSFSRAFRYMRFSCVRIWSTVWVVYGRTATEWVNNKVENLIKEHCLPLEISLNRSWHWWILPFTNKVELDIIRHLPDTDEQTDLLHAMSPTYRNRLVQHIEILKSRILLVFKHTGPLTSVARLVLLLAEWLALIIAGGCPCEHAIVLSGSLRKPSGGDNALTRAFHRLYGKGDLIL